VHLSLSHAHTFATDRLVDNGARILRARNLCRVADSETNAVVSKKGVRRAGVDAQVEVDICPVLVGSCKAVLRAEGIAFDGAEVVDHYDNACASIGQGVTTRVDFTDQFPAGSASRACSGAWCGTV